MEETTTYTFSSASLKQNLLNMIVLLIAIPVALAVFTFAISSPLASSVRLNIIIALTVPLEIVLIVATIITHRKLRELTLTLSPQTLERSGGRATETLSYADINRVDVVEKPSGQIVYLKIAAVEGKRLNLQGFEQMDAIAQRITQHLPDQSQVHTKRWAVDWSSALFSLATIAGAFMVVALLTSVGPYALNLFNIILMSGMGVYFLRAKPMTRSLGKRFETYEKVSGIIMIVAAIISGAAFLLTLSLDWARGL